MPEISTETVVAEAPVKTKKPRKAKATNGKPAKAPKASANGKAKKRETSPRGGLRVPQIRILKYLAKTPAGDPRGWKSRTILTQVACTPPGKPRNEKATMNGSILGCADEKARKVADDKAGKPSLLTLGYVRFKTAQEVAGKGVEIDEPSTMMFEITASGRKALEALDK